jgi:hypothetical protein
MAISGEIACKQKWRYRLTWREAVSPRAAQTIGVLELAPEQHYGPACFCYTGYQFNKQIT